ncbi:hypothetical protein AX16_002999 [Volvariella volvacea WC 439]|nr:hypothetical protein AX16_002999 [Volvariella volvacea WC 439]
MAALGELHHPQPLTYSATPSSSRPSSRSERLLRSTLLRDELERNPLPPTPLTPPPPTTVPRDHHSTGRTHRRRHSHVPSTGNSASNSQSAVLLKHYQYTHPHSPTYTPPQTASPYPEESSSTTQYALGSFLFRSAITNPSVVASPGPSKKRSAAAAGHYDGDHEDYYTYNRHRSISPAPTSAPTQLGRRHSLRERTSGNLKRNSCQEECMGITPHELVLKARLERVLHAGAGFEQREWRQREQERSLEREEQPFTRSRRQSNEVRDEEDGWPWKDRESNSPTMPTPPGSNKRSSVHSIASSHSQQYPQTQAQPSHVRNRSPLPPSPPLSATKQQQQHEAQGNALLTPPPTPPSPTHGGLPRSSLEHQQQRRHHGHSSSIESHSPPSYDRDRREEVTRDGRRPSLARQKSYSPSASDYSHDSSYGPSMGSNRPTFNARKASEACKAMEGYVSFASIEGLGEPPEDPNSPTDDEREGRRAERGRGMWSLRGVSLDWRKLLGGSTGTGKEE